MIIKHIGNSLAHILPELVGQDISRAFDLARPLIEFKYASVRLKLYSNIYYKELMRLKYSIDIETN